MTTATYAIKGMTCGHCVSSVRSELSELEGVSDVVVDLEAGTATVTSDRPVDLAAVHAAVAEAGYEVAS
jgi:copper chaperone